jgi:predicted transcriptional regulator
MKSEERLLPIIRAHLAEVFARQGLESSEIARALNVSQPAVSQYLKGKRGKYLHSLNHLDTLALPLAEKIAKRIRSGQGGLETIELLETARQLMVMNKAGGSSLTMQNSRVDKNVAAMRLLRERLQLELKAAEKYLELSNRTADEHTKLLLRLIASDSIRHADIVSQVISWLEIGGSHQSRFESLNQDLLREMLSLEDSASEVNLRNSIKSSHPVATLLLEWIDTDEEKHEKIVRKMARLGK